MHLKLFIFPFSSSATTIFYDETFLFQDSTLFFLCHEKILKSLFRKKSCFSLSLPYLFPTVTQTLQYYPTSNPHTILSRITYKRTLFTETVQCTNPVSEIRVQWHENYRRPTQIRTAHHWPTITALMSARVSPLFGPALSYGITTTTEHSATMNIPASLRNLWWKKFTIPTNSHSSRYTNMMTFTKA